MNILSKTGGEFHFLDKDYKDVFFTDWNDIPEIGRASCRERV